MAYTFWLGTLFGFGSGVWFAYFLFRMPKIRAARKAAQTRKRNTLEKAIERKQGSVYCKTREETIAYLRRFSPYLFDGIEGDIV